MLVSKKKKGCVLDFVCISQRERQICPHSPKMLHPPSAVFAILASRKHCTRCVAAAVGQGSCCSRPGTKQTGDLVGQKGPSQAAALPDTSAVSLVHASSRGSRESVLRVLFNTTFNRRFWQIRGFIDCLVNSDGNLHQQVFSHLCSRCARSRFASTGRSS